MRLRSWQQQEPAEPDHLSAIDAVIADKASGARLTNLKKNMSALLCSVSLRACHLISLSRNRHRPLTPPADARQEADDRDAHDH
jgi:hypothetical protein